MALASNTIGAVLLAIQYRIDVHAYDPQCGACSPACLPCRLEQFRHHTPDEALAAQPAELVEGGRFEIVPVDFYAN